MMKTGLVSTRVHYRALCDKAMLLSAQCFVQASWCGHGQKVCFTVKMRG